MKKYEIIFLVKVNCENQTFEKIQEIILQQGDFKLKHTIISDVSLAYKIQNETKGSYIVVQLEDIKTQELNFKNIPEIMRYRVYAVDYHIPLQAMSQWLK